MGTPSSTEREDSVSDPAARPGRRRARRLTIVTTGLLAVAGAGAVAWNQPTGNDAVEPGPILDLASRVHVDAHSATPINGAFVGLIVSIHPMTLGDQVIHAITGDPATIVPDAAVRPTDVPAATYHKIEKAAYVDGGQIAGAVAERALGNDVTVSTDGLTVQSVQAGSPASHALRANDRIVAVNGNQVDSSIDLADAIHHSAGQPVTLGVEDAAESTPHQVRVTPVAASETDDRLVIGVVVGPANLEVQLQLPVTVDASGVEGPSAGLMTALTVYDELSPTDLAAGRRIAGTGTLDVDGNVGEIGGIRAKARAAAAAGTQLFLAPASQAADARAVLGSRIPVIGVTTFQQALDALHATPTPTSPA